MYWNKTHLECYIFFQQYENHFGTVGAKSQNWVLFATIFLKDTTQFCCQYQQQRVEDETDLLIT